MEKLNYTITLDDCSDYVKYQLKIRRVRKFVMKAFIPFWIIGLIISAVSLLHLFYPHEDTTIGYIIQEIVIVVLPIVLMWVAIFGSTLALYRYDLFHLLSKRVYKMLQGGALDVELEVKDDGLYAEGKGVSSVMKWDGIIDIYDTGKTFLVFISDYRAVIVPKRAFETEESAQEFFKFVNAKLDAKKV